MYPLKGYHKQMGIKDGKTHSTCKGAGEAESEAAGGNLMDAADHSDHEVSPVNTEAVLTGLTSWSEWSAASIRLPPAASLSASPAPLQVLWVFPSLIPICL